MSASVVRELIVKWGFQFDNRALDSLNSKMANIEKRATALGTSVQKAIGLGTQHAKNVQKIMDRSVGASQHLINTTRDLSSVMESSSKKIASGLGQYIKPMSSIASQANRIADRANRPRKGYSSKGSFSRSGGNGGVISRIAGSAMMGASGMNPMQMAAFPLMIGLGPQVAAITALGGAIGYVGSKMISTSISFEDLKVSMTAFLGSEKDMNIYFKKIQDFAARTPFALQDVVGYFNQLLASGFTKEQALPMLNKLSDAAAGVKAINPDALERIIRAISQTSDHLFAQELNQLIQTTLPIVPELARQLGVSEGKVRGLIKEGKVSRDVLIKAFTDPIGEMKKFQGLSEKMANTVSGKWQNIGEVITNMFGESESSINKILKMAEDKLMETVVAVKGYFTDAFSVWGEGDAAEGFKNFLEMASAMVKVLAFSVSGLLMDLGLLVKWFSENAAVLRIMGATTLGFMAGGPGGALLAGLGQYGMEAMHGSFDSSSIPTSNNLSNTSTISTGPININVQVPNSSMTEEEVAQSTHRGFKRGLELVLDQAKSQFATGMK